MNKTDDAQRFKAAFTRLQIIFPTKTIESESDRLNIYWRALRPFDIKQVEEAFTHICNTQKESFFPTPARIIDVIKELTPKQVYKPAPEPVDNTPVNNTGSAYMLYCVARGQEWDGTEYETFKTDYAAGRVRVERRDATVTQPGRPNLSGGTVVTWNKEAR